MTEFTIWIANDSTASSSQTDLGFDGEHNAIKLVAKVDAQSKLCAASYFRFVFDNYMSEPLEMEENKVSYLLPQSVLVPPQINIQLCGYTKNALGEYTLIAKSGIFSANVLPSVTATIKAPTTGNDVFEEAVSSCEQLFKQTDALVAAADSHRLAAERCEENCEKYVQYCDITYEAIGENIGLAEKHATQAVDACESAEAAVDYATSVAYDAEQSALRAENSANAAAEVLGSVYTKEETDSLLAKKENLPSNYELIFNQTLSENANVIEITADNNGNPLKLSSYYLFIKLPATTTPKRVDGYIQAAKSDGNNLMLINLYTSPAATTTDKFFTAGGERKNGVWLNCWKSLQKSNNKDGLATREYTSHQALAKTVGAYMSKIRLSTAESGYDVGTEIYLYGVRE